MEGHNVHNVTVVDAGPPGAEKMIADYVRGIAGDLLRYQEGQVAGPVPGYTEDPAMAAASLARAAELAFQSMYGYHGASLTADADRMVASLAG